MNKDKAMNLTAPIVIIDDQKMMTDLTTSIIHSMKLEPIVSFCSSKRALEYILSNDVSMIISDWNMPELSGIELLGQLRNTDKDKTTPFLMLTAEAELENIQKAIQLGVTDYITKPFTCQVLTKKITAIINRSNN